MGKAMMLLSGIGLGAGLMCLLDPVSGKRRRALLRDKTLSAWQRTEDAIDSTTRDLENRFHGLRIEAEHLLREGRLSGRSKDGLLAFEVRAALALVATSPQAIRVTVNQGVVTLRGAVLKQDLEETMSAISAVRGIEGVNNHLVVYHRPEQMPPESDGAGLFSEHSPEGRLALGTAGSALVLYGLSHRGIVGTAAGLTGLSLLTRSYGSDKLQRLLGMSERHSHRHGGTPHQHPVQAPAGEAPKAQAGAPAAPASAPATTTATTTAPATATTAGR
jgi:hypothetical protein